MATDNHRNAAVLFPDPQEIFDPRWQQDTELGAPPQGATPLAASPNDHLGDPDRSPPPGATDGDDFFVDDAAPSQATTADDVGSAEPDTYPGEVAGGSGPVPYWVSAHVPADRLVMDEPHSRFLRRRIIAPPQTQGGDAESPPTSPTRRRRSISLGWTAAAIIAAVSVIGAAIVVVGSGEATPVPPAAAPQPSSSPRVATTPPPTSTPAPAPWCTTAVTADATTTDGAGGRDSAVGVIAAFEYAYYVQRSGTAVAALMVSPAPPERIQAVIDRTPAGTEHCVTIAAANTPDVHAVALALRTPSGSESAIASRITTTTTRQGYAIANVEEVR
jgi:hypothetical protein